MFERLSHRMVALALQAGLFKQEEEELYLYAYQSLLWQLLNWMTFLVIGVVFHAVLETILFLSMFIPLRSYAGGFHQRSYFSCYLSSIGIYLFVVLACSAGMLVISPALLSLPLGVAAVAVYFLAPIEDANKPLTADEVVRYGRYARSILTVELVAIAAMILTHLPLKCIFFAVSAVCTVAVLLVFSRIQLSYLSRQR